MELLYQTEATQIQYIFCFILVNLIILITYRYKYVQKSVAISWLLILIYCLFAFWDPDYFTFRRRFYTTLEDFRDPLYYFISFVSFDSYTLFRLIIWGVALYLFYKIIKINAIPHNTILFIFSVSTLALFSQMRCSLGLAMYCYGLSLLMINKRKRIKTYLLGIMLICVSYYGHRSMILPIVLTPMIYMKPNKFNIIAVIFLLIFIGRLSGMFLSNVNSGAISVDVHSGLTGSVDALEHYASKESVVISNWKYTLTLFFRRHSFTLMYIYCLWICFFSKQCNYVPYTMKQLMFIVSALFITGISFLYVGNLGANVIGERLLFYTSIPLCIILTCLRTLRLCKSWMFYISLLPAILFVELFILGKIISF